MSSVSRLPGPSADVWEWQRYGACRGRDSGQFFHPDGERGASRLRREIAAKSICRACPVRAQCAAHALTVREPYGVWGGFTETERLRLLAAGWEDLVRAPGRVDVGRLEARLGASGGVAAPPMVGLLPTPRRTSPIVRGTPSPIVRGTRSPMLQALPAPQRTPVAGPRR
jgi:WhiB family redox-sensing transcriptional regulator